MISEGRHLRATFRGTPTKHNNKHPDPHPTPDKHRNNDMRRHLWHAEGNGFADMRTTNFDDKGPDA